MRLFHNFITSMSAYLPINKQKLIQFLAKQVDHVDNPEQFRNQMDKEILNMMKNQETHLKQIRSKMRMKHIQDITIMQREQLKKKLEDRIKIGTEKKIKTIQDRVQSMIDLRKRKEEYVAMQLQIKRRQSLDNSLKLIQAIQDRSSKVQKMIISKSASDSRLKTVLSSQMQRKQDFLQAQYKKTVDKLKNKGLYDLPDRQKINDLYAKRAKHVKKQLQRKEEQNLNAIGEHYSKVDRARKRKEQLLLVRLQKIRSIQQFQQKVNQSKFRQVSQKQEEKRKNILKKQAQKIFRVQSLIESRVKHQTSREKIKVTLKQQFVKELPSIRSKFNYKQAIRKQIAVFMKKEQENSIIR